MEYPRSKRVQLNLFNTISFVCRTYRNTNGIVISRVTCRVNKQEKRGFNTKKGLRYLPHGPNRALSYTNSLLVIPIGGRYLTILLKVRLS